MKVLAMCLATFIGGGLAASDPQTPLRVDSEGVSAPTRTGDAVAPDWPEGVAEVDARLMFQAVIETSGAVRDPELLSCKVKDADGQARTDADRECELFAASARKALSQWNYNPALKDGNPVAVYFSIMVSFDHDPDRS